jgi:hypothetical protein
MRIQLTVEGKRALDPVIDPATGKKTPRTLWQFSVLVHPEDHKYLKAVKERVLENATAMARRRFEGRMLRADNQEDADAGL